jgi:DNA-binding NtrC family response regulator
MGIKKVPKTLLIIDDDQILCHSVKDHFCNNGTEILMAHTGAEGLAICARKQVDAVLLDQNLPDGKGNSLCPQILKHNEMTKIIFITAYASFENAVEAMKAGAHNYLSKPFELEELSLAVEHAFRDLRLERVEELQNYRGEKESGETLLVGEGLVEIQRLVTLAADSAEAPVLITGETGTGKNMVAKSIHYNSRVRRNAFVSVNCAALPESLIEAELFGYEKGAFTGATAAKKGIFEMAEGGTLFLDEITEMPLHLQSKLLSVLDDKKIKRLGGELTRPVNVRVIAATNRNIETAVASGAFRKDIYYRLSVIRIHIPPLRERCQDIPVLCDYLLRKIAGASAIKLSEDEVSRLMEYNWPGNVRELKNILERAFILQKGSPLMPSRLLCKAEVQASCAPLSANLPILLKEVEKKHIEYALRSLSYNYSRTAKALGISLSTLKRNVKRYGLTPQTQPF